MGKQLRRVARFASVVGFAVVGFAPAAGAGEVGFTATDCAGGVTIDWTDVRGLATAPSDPPVDVWSMVVESVRVNGLPIGFTVSGPTRVITAPVTATGSVAIELTVHWHADRPNGTTYDTVSMPRAGAVGCGEASLPPGTGPSSSVEAVSPSTSGSRGGALPGTGTDVRRPLVVAALLVVAGAAGFGASRRRPA